MPLPTAAELTDPNATNTQMKHRLGQLTENIDRSYLTFAEAIADINNIPSGVIVKIIESLHYGDYKKVGGSLIKIDDALSLSQEKIDAVEQQILSKIDEVNSEIYNSKANEITAVGSFNVANDAILKLLSANLSISSSNYTHLTITTSDDTHDILIFPGDSIVNNQISSYYSESNKNLNVFSVTLDNVTRVVRINLQASVAPNMMSGDILVVDTEGDFMSSKMVAERDPENRYCFKQSADNYIILLIHESEILNAGYQIERASVENYLSNNFPNKTFHYYSTVATNKTIQKIFAQSNTSVSVSIVGSEPQFKLGVFSKSSQAPISGAHYRIVSEVKNLTNDRYTNFPIELKVKFPQNIAKSIDNFLIKDTEGNFFTGQFADSFGNQLRDQVNIGFYSDGSLNTGSIWIEDSVEALSEKKYELSVLTNPVIQTELKETENQMYVEFSAFNSTYKFSKQKGMRLSKIVKNGVEMTMDHDFLFGTFHSDLNQVSQVYATLSPTFKIVAAGPVFIEAEVVSYTSADIALEARAIKTLVRYRIFKSGRIQIRTFVYVEKEIAHSKLYSCYSQISSSYNYIRDEVTGGALISSPIGNIAFSQIVANGDEHREGVSYGPSRPVVSRFGGEQTFRSLQGWGVDRNSISFLQYGIEKGWCWTTESWFDFNPDSAQTTIAKKIHNRPIGFFYEKSAPRLVLNKIADSCLAVANAFADEVIEKGVNQTSLNYPHLQKLVEIAKGDTSIDLADIYYKFKQGVVNSYGNFSQLGSKYLQGGLSTAFAVWQVLLPMEWFFKIATIKSNQAVIDDLKVAIGSLATGMAQKAVSNAGYVNILGTQTGLAAANLQTIALYHIGLAIYADIDSDGSLLSAYNMIEDTLRSDHFNRYNPIINDYLSSAPLAARQYLIYEAVIANTYLKACELISRTPIFNMSNHFLKAIDGNGRYDEIHYCISESRRGGMNLPLLVLPSFLAMRSGTFLSAALESLKAYERDWTFNETTTDRLYGYSYAQNGIILIEDALPHRVLNMAFDTFLRINVK